MVTLPLQYNFSSRRSNSLPLASIKSLTQLFFRTVALMGGSLSRQHARMLFFAAAKSCAIAFAPKFPGIAKCLTL